MSRPPLPHENKPDWKAYALGELPPDERRQAEAHAAACADCREELATLRLTLDALATLREEEIPRRIAFVSDKVFEPRWWQRVFSPSFAGACLVAAAILVHAFARPSPADPAVIQSRVDAAVARAVADTDRRYKRELEQVLADYEIVAKQNSRLYAINTGLEH